MLDWFILKHWGINTALIAGWFTFLTFTDAIALIGGIIGIIAGILKVIEHFQIKNKTNLEIKLLEKKINKVDETNNTD